MIPATPNTYSRGEPGNYNTLQTITYPDTFKPQFLPSLIPVDANGSIYNSKFAELIAQQYRCLSGASISDCCQKVCGVPSNEGKVQDYLVANNGYEYTQPNLPIPVRTLNYRTM